MLRFPPYNIKHFKETVVVYIKLNWIEYGLIADRTVGRRGRENILSGNFVSIKNSIFYQIHLSSLEIQWARGLISYTAILRWCELSKLTLNQLECTQQTLDTLSFNRYPNHPLQNTNNCNMLSTVGCMGIPTSSNQKERWLKADTLVSLFRNWRYGQLLYTVYEYYIVTIATTQKNWLIFD